MSSNEENKGWVVRRKSDSEVELVLPDGLLLTSNDLTIEDIVEAIEKHKIISKGKPTGGRASDEVTIRCCSGNTAIAAL